MLAPQSSEYPAWIFGDDAHGSSAGTDRMTIETRDLVAPADNIGATSSRVHQFFRVAANLLLLGLIALWIFAMVLQTGVMRRSETITGPFAAESVSHSKVMMFPLKKIFVVRGLVRAISDAESTSSLQLWINGHPTG